MYCESQKFQKLPKNAHFHCHEVIVLLRFKVQESKGSHPTSISRAVC